MHSPSQSKLSTLIADEIVRAVPLRESNEPLVALAEHGILVDAAAPEGRMVRRGLAERLATAQAQLPAGITLLVREGARSIETQRRIALGYLATLRVEHPAASEDEILRLSTRFVAPIDAAPHVAGAAVDVTLAGPDGELWMGTDIDATPEQSLGACFFDAQNIDAESRANRALLGRVLSAAGLVNYPTEWWHWSFGDRYWAYRTDAAHAIYGPRGELL